MATLDEIAQVSDGKAKTEQYNAALNNILASGDVSACKEFVDHGAGLLRPAISRSPPPPRAPPPHPPPALPPRPSSAVLSDAVPLTLSRQLLNTLAASLPQLPPDSQKATAQ